MLGGTQELNDYILKAQGISRKGLNIIIFIGVFLFGWLLAVAFDMLGKKGTGWCYLIPLIVILAMSRHNASEIAVAAPIIYVAGWIHANVVLSKYQSVSRNRISEITSIPVEQLTADLLLEKGILQHKVLRESEASVETLKQALALPVGSSPQLLNIPGSSMLSEKHYAEAKQFFDKALLNATDATLIKQNIKKNQLTTPPQADGVYNNLINCQKEVEISRDRGLS